MKLDASFNLRDSGVETKHKGHFRRYPRLVLNGDPSMGAGGLNLRGFSKRQSRLAIIEATSPKWLNLRYCSE